MKATIYMAWENGSRDSLEIEGESIEEIREKANREVSARTPDDYWSEVQD